MKPGWETKKLGDVCSLIARGIAPKYTDGDGVRVVNQKCVRGHVVNFDLARRHDASAKPVATARLLRAGDGLVNSTGEGTLGRVAMLREEPSEPTTVDTHVTILRPRPETFYPPFFGILLTTIEDEIAASGEGASGQTELSRTLLRDRFQVSYPIDLAEQRRIVEALDEAFAGLATATANAEQTLANARELFRSFVADVFVDREERWPQRRLGDVLQIARGGSPRPIEAFLTDDPDGLNWIKIGDATASRKYISETAQRIKPDGAKRSRIVEPGDFLLSNSMSFGRPYIMRTRGCIHDGWLVLKDRDGVFDQDYLYAFLGSAAAYAQFDRLAAGSTVRNLNIELVERTIVPVPELIEQSALAERVQVLENGVARLEAHVCQKLALLAELKTSLLHRAFAGELVNAAVSATMAAANDDFTTPEAAANVIAFAQRRHEIAGTERTFGRVKAQKVLQLVEAVGKLDLGREPMKDAAGPNDFPHMLRAQEWAETQNFFTFVPRHGGTGFDFKKLADYDAMWARGRTATKPISDTLARAIEPVVPMNSLEAELLATVQAAWNNLIIDDAVVTDDAIVREARENWHIAKMKIPRQKFYDAIKQVRALGIVPDGTAKRVGGQEHLL